MCALASSLTQQHGLKEPAHPPNVDNEPNDLACLAG